MATERHSTWRIGDKHLCPVCRGFRGTSRGADVALFTRQFARRGLKCKRRACRPTRFPACGTHVTIRTLLTFDGPTRRVTPVRFSEGFPQMTPLRQRAGSRSPANQISTRKSRLDPRETRDFCVRPLGWEFDISFFFSRERDRRPTRIVIFLKP